MLSNQTRWCIQSQFPRANCAIIRACEKQVTIDGHARHRVSVPLHLLLECSVAQTVCLNVAIVTSNEDCAFVSVLISPELEAQDLVTVVLAFKRSLNFTVLDNVSQLRIDGCSCAIHTSSCLL